MEAAWHKPGTATEASLMQGGAKPGPTGMFCLKENWPAFREKLKAQVYPYSKMKELFRIVGAPTEPEHVGVTRKYLLYRTDFVQLMRWRFNIYDLAKRGMFYDELVHATFDRMGTLAF